MKKTKKMSANFKWMIENTNGTPSNYAYLLDPPYKKREVTE